MPQTGMDWWIVAGVLVTALGVWFAWRQSRKIKSTRNSIKGGNRNKQAGGSGSTVNQVDGGDDNEQRG